MRTTVLLIIILVLLLLIHFLWVVKAFGGEHRENSEYSCQTIITPSITPTPTIEKDEAIIEESHDTKTENVVSNDTTHRSNPTCDTPKPGDVDVVAYSQGEPGNNKITLNWSLPLRAHTVNICYGREEGNCEYGLSDVLNTGSVEIGGLNNNESYWFAIQGQDGCATGNWSTWIDPTP